MVLFVGYNTFENILLAEELRSNSTELLQEYRSCYSLLLEVISCSIGLITLLVRKCILVLLYWLSLETGIPWLCILLSWVLLLSLCLLFAYSLSVVLMMPNIVKSGGVVREYMFSSWLIHVGIYVLRWYMPQQPTGTTSLQF